MSARKFIEKAAMDVGAKKQCHTVMIQRGSYAVEKMALGGIAPSV